MKTVQGELRAVFRCDGGSDIGLGHVTRCLALADALAGEGWRCIFAGSAETANLPVLALSGFDVVRLDKPLDARSLGELPGLPADLLIIDHYALDRNYETVARFASRAIMVLDDLTGRRHDCDMLLDAGYGRSPDDYRATTNAGCVFLCGERFALLRQSIAQVRDRSLRRRESLGAVNRVFVCFGGVDRRGLCQQALQALGDIPGNLEVDVVIGATAPHLDELRRLAFASPHQVRILEDCLRVADLLESADVAMGAVGVNAWERCAAGLPSVVACVAENQRPFFDALVRNGAAVGVEIDGGNVAGALREGLGTLFRDAQLRRDVSRRSAGMCDVQGPRRATATIENFRLEQAVGH